MFYDYVAIEKYIPTKDNIQTDLLKERFKTPNGLTYYYYNVGFKNIEVSFNEYTRYLNIKGSFPYAFQGHNFFFANSNFYNGLENFEKTLKINLLDANLNAFEFGTIVKSDKPPIETLNKHSVLNVNTWTE